MTVNVPDRPATREPAWPGVRRWPLAPGRDRGPVPTARDQDPSSRDADRVRALSRGQVEDRLGQLGDLYADTAGGKPWARERDRDDFLRGLAVDLRRPGFALLIAETTVVTGCAYGFPVDDRGAWWRGVRPDGSPSADPRRPAAPGRLFAISRIVVQPPVRTRHQGHDGNLARRLQRRLLADHDATAGITLVSRTDAGMLKALLSWGWREAEAATGGEPLPASPWHVLILDA
ncbi:hypothetical protein AB0N31_16780 [Streptomyces sp. NPDC051051]|uniref:hypothetical protein n=1 Tax=Streptomyces sp. NPDC051051 TaxID=3155666 RepID=UPI0034432DB3